MLKKVWEIIKENFMVIIAVFTSIFTIIYAALKLAIYVYWSGYFYELNIDSSFMKLNYDGFIYQVIFITLIMVIILYLMGMVNDLLTTNRKSIWKKEAKLIKKVKMFIKIVTLDFVVCVLFLSVANGPLIITLCVWRKVDLSIANVFIMLCFLFIIEILMLIIQRIDVVDKNKSKRSLEKRIEVVLLSALFLVSFSLAGAYYYGSVAIENKNKISLVDNGNYAITYSDGSKYILHKVQMNGNVLIIYRNEQMVINNEKCTYTVKDVEKIIISD